MALKFNPISANFDLVRNQTSWIAAVPTEANLPTVGNVDGDARIVTATSKVYIWSAAAGKWQDSKLDSASFGSSPNSSGYTLSPQVNPNGIDYNALVLQPADATNPGALSTGTQTIAGAKTFNSPITADIDRAAGTLALGATATTINIGGPGATVNIQGNTVYENVSQLQVKDPLITLNKGGAAASASGSGIEVEEDGSDTGYVKISSNRNSWAIKAPNSAGEVLLTPGAGGITLDQSSHNPVTLGTSNGLSLSVQELSLQTASSSQPGALSSADWSTFNAKQPAGNYITALTGDVTASGPGSASATVAFVGGSSAANINSAELAANAATPNPTSSTIVKRDSSGNFSAGTITANITGNVSGSAASFTGILAGDVTGAQSSTSIASNVVMGKLLDGYASVAGPTIVQNTDNLHTALGKLNGNLVYHANLNSGVHGVSGQVVGTTDSQTLTNKTISGLNNTLTNIPSSAIVGSTDANLQKITGDINPSSASLSNDQAAAVDVSGLAFANASVRHAMVDYSIRISATTPLYESGTLLLIQKASGWDMAQTCVGDDSRIVLSVNSSGQIQYTSPSYDGFTAGVMKFRAVVTPT